METWRVYEPGQTKATRQTVLCSSGLSHRGFAYTPIGSPLKRVHERAGELQHSCTKEMNNSMRDGQVQAELFDGY